MCCARPRAAVLQGGIQGTDEGQRQGSLAVLPAAALRSSFQEEIVNEPAHARC